MLLCRKWFNFDLALHLHLKSQCWFFTFHISQLIFRLKINLQIISFYINKGAVTIQLIVSICLKRKGFKFGMQCIPGVRCSAYLGWDAVCTWDYMQCVPGVRCSEYLMLDAVYTWGKVQCVPGVRCSVYLGWDAVCTWG